jgi:hypothetical protein
MTKTRKNNKPIKGGAKGKGGNAVASEYIVSQLGASAMGPIHSLIKYIIKYALKNINEGEGANMFYDKLKRMDCYEDLVNDIINDLVNVESIDELIDDYMHISMYKRKLTDSQINKLVELILTEAGLYTHSLMEIMLEDRVIADKIHKIFNGKGLNRLKALPNSMLNQLGVENLDELAGHFEDDKISPFSSSPRTINSDSI